MSFSDFLENELLDHVFGAAAYTAPATIYVALFTADPDDAGAGGTECAAGDYARLAVTNNATNFPAASAGAKANGTDFEFPQASSSWGTITFVGLYDASTSGNYLGGAGLTVDKAVGSGDTFRIATGDLDITLA